jgi:sulfur-carrier protein adenylyltransferase/sulfurtransferase
MRDHLDELEISPELVREMVDAGEPFVLLDVREDWEWERAHLDGAVHIPMAELESKIESLDPSAEIVVYCHHGDRSVDACLVLWNAGFRKVRNLTGGINAWSELIDPSVPRY